MRSDRNWPPPDDDHSGSLVDWDMRSDRNTRYGLAEPHKSLVDWDMRSDQNDSGVCGAVISADSLTPWLGRCLRIQSSGQNNC